MPSAPMILVNGVITDSVPATDRGLAYGDGVFRTLLIRKGRPLHWQVHYTRLAADCSAIRLGCPEPEILRSEIAQAAHGDPDCVLKIIVTRGAGRRGYAIPENCQPTRIILTASLPQYPDKFAHTGVTARICDIRLAPQPALAGIKHLNRLENILARMEWNDPSIAEGLLLDIEGNVIGGTMTNLFIVENGELITPELARCGVAGVTRKRLIDSAAMHGKTCRTENISRQRLLQADEIFLVNSVIGVWQVAEIGVRSWEPGMVARQVREWLDIDDD